VIPDLLTVAAPPISKCAVAIAIGAVVGCAATAGSQSLLFWMAALMATAG
jgi:hypothetical protein